MPKTRPMEFLAEFRDEIAILSGATLTGLLVFWLIGLLPIPDSWWPKIGQTASAVFAWVAMAVWAMFRIWRGKELRIAELQALIEASPRLLLRHSTDDPLCVHEPSKGRPIVLRVGVINLGSVRAKGVSVALHNIEPVPMAGAAHFLLPEMHTMAGTFEVPSVKDRKPTAHVDVIEQGLQGDGKSYWYRLCLASNDGKRNIIPLTDVTPRLRITLRIEADLEAEPYDMIFEPDADGRLEVVSEPEYRVEFSSSLLPSWRERWGFVRRAKP
jgi:hypothetical protein